MKVLMILNAPPYGSERSYNALRLAGALTKQPGVELRIFLIGDAVTCAKDGQKVPPGYYNVQTMIGSVTRRGGKVGVCGTCIDARGILEAELVESADRSSMDELASWTLDADKVLIF